MSFLSASQLPSGARDIVLNLAAQQIFELELQDALDQQCLSADQESRLLALVSQYPSVCQTPYLYGDMNAQPQYPLLTILKLQPSLELTEAVFRAYPAALSETQQGFRPIDLACWKRASRNVVAFLHQCHPQATATKCKGVMHPLHIALHHGADQGVLEFLLHACPRVAQQPDTFGKFPLHHACGSTNTPVSIVKTLIRLAPTALVAHDAQGFTPLHRACRSGRDNHQDNNLAIVQALAQAAPAVLHRPNALGNSPLKLAAMYQTPEVLDFLLEQPQPQVDDDEDDVTLLHLAARVNHADTVGYLAQRFPAMLHATSRQSRNTPLHYACERTDDSLEAFRVVRVLVKHGNDTQALLQLRNTREQSPLCVAQSVQPGSKAARFLTRRQQQEQQPAQQQRALRTAQSFGV